MTTTRHQHRQAPQHVTLGRYVSEDVEHTLIATRSDDARWTLIDNTEDETTIVEAFYRDEELAAVQAVVELYLNDMTALAERDAIT